MRERYPAAYQALLVGLLSLNFGVLFFDRNALSFLMPYVQPDLKLNFTQVGVLGSALSLTWAISGLSTGWLSDKLGRRKLVLVVATLAYSICSVGSGLAGTFAVLMATRLMMGLAEGGVAPISHALVAAEVKPERRGLAMGVTQNLGSNLLGSSVAPLLLVPMAEAFGWRHAFFLTAAPGLICAFLIILIVREPQNLGTPEGPKEKLSFAQAFAERNILLCALIAILLVAYLVICWAFMPLILTKMRGFDANTAKWLMATLGISAGIGSFVVPGISDWVGRKPVLIVTPLIGVILPLGAAFYSGPMAVMVAIFFVGWALNGVFPLFMATIPSETVDAKHTATVMGLVMGTGEILGGVFGPTIAGRAADAYGLQAPLWIMLGLCITAGLLAFGLKETAPRCVARRRAAQPAMAV